MDLVISILLFVGFLLLGLHYASKDGLVNLELLRKQVQVTRRFLDDTIKQLERESKSFIGIIYRIWKEKFLFDQERENLKRVLETITRERNRFKKDLDAVRKDRDKLLNEMSYSDTQKGNLTYQLKQAEEECARLRARSAEVAKEKGVVQAELDSLKRSVNDNANINQVIGERNAFRDQKYALLIDKEKLESKLRDTQLRESAAQQQIQELTSLLEQQKLTASEKDLKKERIQVKTTVPELVYSEKTGETVQKKAESPALFEKTTWFTEAFNQMQDAGSRNNEVPIAKPVVPVSQAIKTPAHPPIPTAPIKPITPDPSRVIKVSPEKYAQIQQIRAEVEASKQRRQHFQKMQTAASQQVFKLATSFSSSRVIGSYTYHYLVDYIPMRIHSNSVEVHQHRQVVYDFKDGKSSSQVAGSIASALKNKYSYNDLQAGVFVVIPASTREKNEDRFKSFCQQVSSLTGLANGYDGIYIRYDREALKGKVNTNKTSNLGYNANYVKGKTVFLFDDVMTTGSSFLQNADELKKKDAARVIGVFLAKTVSQQ